MDYSDVQFVTPDDDPASTPVRHDGGLSVAPAVSMNVPPASQSRFDWDGAAQLNARYTFDAFVIGSGNQFAHAACQAVSQRPSKAYNPPFLYATAGTANPHLIQPLLHHTIPPLPQHAGDFSVRNIRTKSAEPEAQSSFLLPLGHPVARRSRFPTLSKS